MATGNPKEAIEIKKLKEESFKKAEQCIFNVFPGKIKEIGEKLESPMFSFDDMTQIHCDLCLPVPLSSLVNGIAADDEKPSSKRRKCEPVEEFHSPAPSIGQKVVPNFTDLVPSNSKIEAIIDYLKPEIITSIQHCSTIKLWIQLMIPKIEDGNNFGVSIQEDILSEVTKAESDATTYLDQIARYFTLRGKMISKVAKYPHLNDYRRSVNEYDEKVFFSFKLVLTELRNIYVVLYDIIIKNYQKLMHPRSSNSSSLY